MKNMLKKKNNCGFYKIEKILHLFYVIKIHNMEPKLPPPPINNDFYNITTRLPQNINNEIESHCYCTGVCKTECDRLLAWFDNNSELRCSASEVEDLTNYLLESNEAVNYLCEKNTIFKQYYNIHFIEDKKYFVLMSKTCSLISCVLMQMWH